MEGIAIGIWIVGGVMGAPIFCFALSRFIRPYATTARLLFWASIIGLSIFVLDITEVAIFGAVNVRRTIGPAFFPIHSIATLLSAAFLAGSLLLGQRNLARRWVAVAVVSWLLGVFSIFYQYDVAETLYGIDGEGGPFSDVQSS